MHRAWRMECFGSLNFPEPITAYSSSCSYSVGKSDISLLRFDEARVTPPEQVNTGSRDITRAVPCHPPQSSPSPTALYLKGWTILARSDILYPNNSVHKYILDLGFDRFHPSFPHRHPQLIFSYIYDAQDRPFVRPEVRTSIRGLWGPLSQRLSYPTDSSSVFSFSIVTLRPCDVE